MIRWHAQVHNRHKNDKHPTPRPNSLVLQEMHLLKFAVRWILQIYHDLLQKMLPPRPQPNLAFERKRFASRTKTHQQVKGSCSSGNLLENWIGQIELHRNHLLLLILRSYESISREERRNHKKLCVFGEMAPRANTMAMLPVISFEKHPRCITYRRPCPNAAISGSGADGFSFPSLPRYRSGMKSNGLWKTSGSCRIALLS